MNTVYKTKEDIITALVKANFDEQKIYLKVEANASEIFNISEEENGDGFVES